MLTAIAIDSDNMVKPDSEKKTLCQVQAPNEVLHKKQDTTHFLFFDGDTIQADGEHITMRWRPTDHQRRQLEHLKQQKLSRRI